MTGALKMLAVISALTVDDLDSAPGLKVIQGAERGVSRDYAATRSTRRHIHLPAVKSSVNLQRK